MFVVFKCLLVDQEKNETLTNFLIFLSNTCCMSFFIISPFSCNCTKNISELKDSLNLKKCLDA